MSTWKLATATMLVVSAFGLSTASAQERRESRNSKVQRRSELEKDLDKAWRRRANEKSGSGRGKSKDQGRFVSIEAIREAISESHQASQRLHRLARDLADLAGRFSSQSLSAKSFRNEALYQLDEMQKLSKQVRKDRILAIIGDGIELEADPPAPSLTLEQFMECSRQLEQMAGQLEERIAFFYEDRDFTQVSLNDIQLPSTESLSVAIEDLSKSLKHAIKKSRQLRTG